MPYLYLLASRRLWFRYKIGITAHLRRRQKDINRDEPYIALLVLPLFGARIYESWLKRRYKARKAKDMRGTGRTEWFIFWLPFRLIFWYLTFAAIEWSVIFLILLLIWL
jgi:hypothetical protein